MSYQLSQQTFTKIKEDPLLIRRRNWQILKQQETHIYSDKELQWIIERCAEQWLTQNRNSLYLLRGEFLSIAEDFYVVRGNLLSFDAHKLIVTSLESRQQTLQLISAKHTRNCLIGSIGATITSFLVFSLPIEPLTPISQFEKIVNINRVTTNCRQ